MSDTTTTSTINSSIAAVPSAPPEAHQRADEGQGRVDYAMYLSFFLLEKTGSVLGEWAGRMSASAQRGLFGRFIGKGTIVINGGDETIRNRVKVCFGQDSDDRNVTKWAAL